MAIKPFTDAEIRAILLDAGIVANAETIAQTRLAINGELATRGAAMAEALFANAIRGATNEAILKKAREQAERQTRKIFGDLAQSEFKSIAEKIETNLRDGKHPFEVARKLDEITGLDPRRAAQYEKYKALLEASDLSDEEIERRLDRYYEQLLSDRKKTIAVTEQRIATGEGNLTIAKERGQKFKAWISTGRGNVCPICQGNEAAGWIPIDKPFPSGDMTVPAHPNDHCTVTYRTAPPSEEAQRRVRERAANTADATGNEA